MPVFKFVISDGKKSIQVEKDQTDAPILNKKIGDTIQGNFLGLEGYELLITGGTDKDGFPMRKDIEGAVKKRIILTKGTGFHAKHPGLRKRKILRGNTINQDITQINCKVVKKGEKPIEELLGIKKEESKQEKKEEPEKKEEAKSEKKTAKKEEKQEGGEKKEVKEEKSEDVSSLSEEKKEKESN